jgi:hypothetical protein
VTAAAAEVRDLTASRLATAAAHSAPARASSLTARAQRREPARLATIAAIDAARGDVTAAARALGVSRVSLEQRLLAWPGVLRGPLGKPESLRAWLDRTWPQHRGRRATDVVSVRYEGTNYTRERVYLLGCGTAEEPHELRVPAVGVVRTRVVCKMCKEAKR